jgi:lipase (class 2)
MQVAGLRGQALRSRLGPSRGVVVVGGVLLLALAGVAAVLAPGRAGASPEPARYAPLDRPGPALHVSAELLANSLTCSAGLATSKHEPILLVPGTTLTPKVDFGWNYERAFTAQARPWCAVTLPQSAMGDVQTAGEYVVNAIRTMHARSGKKVEILGHSQGGMVPRWALRFWPDTRSMVDDVIGMAPSNHGTVVAYPVCPPAIGCAPAFWQQRYGSRFLRALNSGAETFPGISYTDIYTVEDEVVQPNLNDHGSSSLHGGGGSISNVAVQSVCPLHVADHLLVGTADPVAYALVLDALTHSGPADPGRISKFVCGRLVQPGVNPLTFVTDFAGLGAYVATTIALTPHVAAEPPLAPYVLA